MGEHHSFVSDSTLWFYLVVQYPSYTSYISIIMLKIRTNEKNY